MRLERAFEAVSGDLANALVPAAALADFCRREGLVRDGWTAFGFECRLARSDGPVDLGLGIPASSSWATSFGDLGAPGWIRLRSFAEAWESPRSSLRDWCPFVFLEYDAGSGDRPPSVFVALDTPLEDCDPGNHPTLRAANESVSLLLGAVRSDYQAELERCFESLPSAAWLLHVGVMLSRDDSAVRLSVSLARDEIETYLRGLGATDAAEAARDGCRLLDLDDGPIQLDFDLTPSISARVGLGVRMGSSPKRALFDRLVSRGLGSELEIDTLLKWPGITRVSQSELLRREISHVKLTLAPNQIAAKVYVGATLLQTRQSA